MRSRILLAIFLSTVQCCGCASKPKPKPLVLIPLVPPKPDPSLCVEGSLEAIRRCRELYWRKTT